MALISNAEASGNFVDLLEAACERIGERWFLLPVNGPDDKPAVNAYRERVYCYELYHQLRLLSDTAAGTAAGAPEYTLSGEIDKAGLNAVIEGGREKPDLAWHVPGTARNAVVLEVKSAALGTTAGLVKDVKTLSAFLSAGDRAYDSGILLMYGDSGRAGPLNRVRRAVEAADVDRDALQSARLLWHRTVGSAVEDLGTIF